MPARRIKPIKIRQLYRWHSLRLHDRDLLAEVGTTLYDRCEDVITVWRATNGRVPCPDCGKAVFRPRARHAVPLPNSLHSVPQMACSGCNRTVSWGDCRNALRGRPLCFNCGALLRSSRAEQLDCPECDSHWTWKQYRTSVKSRIRLPCPHCGQSLHKSELRRSSGDKEGPRPIPPPVAKILDADGGPAGAPPVYVCPDCMETGTRNGRRFACGSCGYTVDWAKYQARWRNRKEWLQCGNCGTRFSWKDWNRANGGLSLYTGNPLPAAEFLAQWPKCSSPEAQMRCIDVLLHGLHARGALATTFIAGHGDDVIGLLNELASG